MTRPLSLLLVLALGCLDELAECRADLRLARADADDYCVPGAHPEVDPNHLDYLRCVRDDGREWSEPWPKRPLPPALQGGLRWYENFGGERCYCGDIEVDCDGEDTCEPPS